MKYLVCDTETNGLPKSWRVSYLDVQNWPRIVQIAWMAVERKENGDWQQSECYSAVIYPDDWWIPPAVSDVHGITDEKARAEGRPIREVLSEFFLATCQADVLVAHNVDFDRSVILAELLRLDEAEAIRKLIAADYYCTMEAGTSICTIPGSHGWKWPRLSELYWHLFGTLPVNQHRADGDVLACAACLQKLAETGDVRAGR